MRMKLAAALLFGPGLLMGCGPEGPNKADTGMVVGAVAGGILGNQVGGGSGKVLATVAGAVVGGIVGIGAGERDFPHVGGEGENAETHGDAEEGTPQESGADTETESESSSDDADPSAGDTEE